jgi:hypothetical protein
VINKLIVETAHPQDLLAHGDTAELLQQEEENEQLSDMEDGEAGMYLHTAEEAKLKEVIWTELNKDFLEKQAAKKAAAAAAEAKVGAFFNR